MSDLGERPFRLRVLWILLAAGLLMTVPAMRGEILNYDDVNLLLGPEGAFERGPASFFTETYYYAYLPFYGLSYWIDGKLGGGSTTVLHFANALWHVLAGYLVFCLLALLLRNRLGALFGALVFVVHPLHVESVAWISGRKEVMSTALLFLAWLLHLRGRTAWGIAAFLAACFTKATAIVLPGLMLAAALLLPLYEGRRRRAARATLPFFLAAAVPIAVHLIIGTQSGVVREAGDIPARLVSWLNAWGRSVQHTLLPIDLSIDYPEGRASSLGALVVPGLLLAASAVVAWVLRRRAPVVTFGIVAFFVALAPHNNVFPATDVFLADRYLYVALFGVAAMVAWTVSEFRDAPVWAGVAAAVLLGLSLLSAGRFSSNEKLWTKTIAARDDSAVAWFQRGIDRAGRADSATPPDAALRKKAISDLEAALSRAVLKEHRLKACGGLVLPLINDGKAPQALERAQESFDLLDTIDSPEAPRFRAQLLYHRAIAHKSIAAQAYADGERMRAAEAYGRAALDCRTAGELWPRYLVACEEGVCWLMASRPRLAKQALESAASLDRASEVPWIYLAKAERMLGNLAGYRRALEEATRRAPASDEIAGEWVRYHLYGESPNYRKAREALEQLGSSRRRRLLEAQVEAQHALFRFRRGDLKAALAAADKAREIGLGGTREQFDLGQIYMEAGRYDDAVHCFRGSADVLTSQPVHRDAVARAYALKAYRLASVSEFAQAAIAMRSALEARPRVIEAGAVPLRGRELIDLAETRDDRVLALAAAAVAGDPGLARTLAGDLLAGEPGASDTRLVHLMRGLTRAFTGVDFPGAEDDLRRVVATSPGDAWARYRLAQVWLKSGAGWLQTADQLKSEARRKQGRELLDQAIAELSKLIEAQPDFLHARLLRGQAYFSLGRLSEAKSEYVAIREKDPGLKEVYVNEAALHRLSFVRGGSLETLNSAETFLATALDLDPNYFDAMFELGNVNHLRYDRAGSESRRQAFLYAAKWYRRAMAINPQAREPRLEWARLLLKAGQEALAAGEVLRAHQLVERLEAEASDVVDVHKQRVQLNLMPDFGKLTNTPPDAYYEAAGKALDKIAELAPRDPDLPQLRAELHLSRGMSYALTAGRFAAAARKANESKDERADLYEKKSQRARELAVEQYDKALEAWPEHPDAATIRGRMRALDPSYIKRDTEKAKRAYEAAVSSYKAGRFKEAAQGFRQAVLLFPEWVELRYYFGMSLARDGQVDAALKELEQVANGTEAARFPDAMFELGHIFRAKKEEAVARLWYQRYVTAMEKADRAGETGVDIARKILAEIR